MNIADQLAAWGETQKVLVQLSEEPNESPWREDFETVLKFAEINNPWFTRDQQLTAIKGIARLLEPESLKTWIEKYEVKSNAPKKVGVIMAGNIPLAGFHDFLSVLISGNHLVAKLSGSDRHLLPFIAKILFSFSPELASRFEISDQLKTVRCDSDRE
ncbi:MAG TPA: hypothetical protein PKD91_11665 [Bacteroidia bacterium]|nr:hypothetical protein [Bacteroidia bacterium]